MNETEKKKETEDRLIGLWHNLHSDYLWQFFPVNEDGAKIVIIIDEKKPFPGSWMPHYNVFTEDDKFFLELWFLDRVTRHEIRFLADKIIQVENPPVDNAKMQSIILNKV